jgi:2Fe-2S ferredoxin
VAVLGATVMETAINNDVPGILAVCGGSCSCATCHVYVDPEWFEKLGPLSLEELDMLDTAHDLEPTSRLSCQIQVTEEIDGLRVRTPARQI